MNATAIRPTTSTYDVIVEQTGIGQEFYVRNAKANIVRRTFKYATREQAQSIATRLNIKIAAEALTAPVAQTASPRITRLESSESQVMEPTMSGAYVEKAVHSHLWRCDECGLVWEAKWHASECASRGHRTSFEQGPYGCTGVLNGVPQGNLVYYTRQAVRRDDI